MISIGLISAFVYAFMLGSRELGVPDEARYCEIPREMVASGHYITPRLDGVLYFEKPPLFYWLQSLSIHLFGLSQWSMRFWTACFAVIGCVAVYAMGRHLYDRRTGFLSALVLGTSLLYFSMGHIITLDMAVSVLLCLSLFAFVWAETQPLGLSRRWGMGWAFVFAALATLTKGLIGIVFPMMAIGLWIILYWDWGQMRRMYLGQGVLLYLLIAAPWHIMMQLRHPTFFHYYFIRQHFERYLTDVAHRYQPFWYFLPVVFAGLLPWSAFAAQTVRFHLRSLWAERDRNRSVMLLVIWIVSIFVFFSVSDSKLIPYILPIFPPAAILIGRYLAHRWNEPLSRADRIAFFATGVIGVLLGLAIAIAVPATRPSLEPHTMPIVMAWVGAAFALTGVAAAVTGLRRGLSRGVVLLACGFTVFLWGVNAAAHYLDTRSIKPLARVLAPRLTPQSVVACYGGYNQDLPFYLRRRVEIVDFKGELGYGTTLEKTPWVMRGKRFWHQWNGDRTVYLVTNRPTYLRLEKRHILMHMVAQNAFHVIVCNKG
ncbi:MAG: glycosyltransferase family 39 protein [Gammaproteobacteria bacterium]|nr:glycosyltransferase family 39 protein [Gammaproteobacteria bacterium]